MLGQQAARPGAGRVRQAHADPTEVPLGLYLHVPFCAERCHYCYYRSYDQPTHEQTDHYIDVLLDELATYARTAAVADRPVDFVYFGGGTPSWLATRQIQGLFDGVHYQNRASLDRYLQSVSEHGHARSRACVLAGDERMVREFVLQLKLGGASAVYFQKKFGVNVAEFFAAPLSDCEDRGWLKVDDSGVKLTRDGLLRVDRLIPAFHLPRHRDKAYW